MANSAPSATLAVVKGLMELISSRMPSIVQAYDDFPAANQKLKFPSFSIFTKEPKFIPGPAYIVKVGEMIPRPVGEAEPLPNAGKAPVWYCIGKYEFPNMQIDFWCENKWQRHAIQEEFIRAFNDVEPTSGVNLRLSETLENPDKFYYDEWIHAHLGKISFAQDSEVSSQRNEWRLKGEIITQVRCISEKMENLIENIEVNVETTEGDIPSDSSGTGYVNET